MNNKYESYWTHDEEVCEKIFNIKDTYSFLNKSVASGNIEYLRFVSRYLVQYQKLEPNLAKNLLSRYIVVLAYVLLKRKSLINKDLQNSVLDEIYENGLTVDKLLNIKEDANPFIELINKKIAPKRLCEYINKFINDSDNKTKKFVDKVCNLLYYQMDFFQEITKFEYYTGKNKNRRSTDLLIAEARANVIDRSFGFEIPDDGDNYTSFLANVKAQDDIARVIVAHLVNDSIKKGKSLDKVNTISSNELKCYLLNGDKNISDNISFLYDSGDHNYKAHLNAINPFIVVYNNIRYQISKNGIMKI